MPEHHITAKRLKGMINMGIGCREMAHLFRCDRCMDHVRDRFERAGRLDDDNRHHKGCRCTKCRIVDHTHTYQEQHRRNEAWKEESMGRDYKLEELVSKTVRTFLEYFRQSRYTPDRQSVITLLSRVNDLQTRVEGHSNGLKRHGAALKIKERQVRDLEEEVRKAKHNADLGIDRTATLAGRIEALERRQGWGPEGCPGPENTRTALGLNTAYADLPAVVRTIDQGVEEVKARVFKLEQLINRVSTLEAKAHASIDTSDVHGARLRALEQAAKATPQAQHLMDTLSGRVRDLEKLRVPEGIDEVTGRLDQMLIHLREVDAQVTHHKLCLERDNEKFGAIDAQIERLGEQEEVQAWMDASDNPVLSMAQDVERLKRQIKDTDKTVRLVLAQLADDAKDCPEREVTDIERVEGKVDQVLEIVEQLGEA